MDNDHLVKSAVRSALEAEVKKRTFEGKFFISQFKIISDDWDVLVQEMKIEKLRNGDCYRVSLPSYLKVRIQILKRDEITNAGAVSGKEPAIGAVSGTFVGGAAGGVTGASIGVVAGSVVPGIGNLVGAGVGGVIGAGVGGVVGGVVGFGAGALAFASRAFKTFRTFDSIEINAEDILSNFSDFYEKYNFIYATVKL